jgi:hypothetical protein
MRLRWTIIDVLVASGLGAIAEQDVFDTGNRARPIGGGLENAAVKRDSFVIFNEVNSLLRQWVSILLFLM